MATEKSQITYTFWHPPAYHSDLGKSGSICFPRSKMVEVHAKVGKTVIGVFRYEVKRRKSKKLLIACGTRVVTQYRKKGIAKGLWEIAIKQVKPTHIDVMTVSTEGERLVNSLARKYPQIDWMVTHGN